MISEIQRLLAEAGVTFAVGRENLIMTANNAPVPAPPWHVGEGAGARFRGFNLVVVRDGRPVHFVKCRPAGDPLLARDSRIRNCLAGRRPHGLSVADVSTAASPAMAVQVSIYLRGRHYGFIVRDQSPADYIRDLGAVLAAGDELMDTAVRAAPDLVPPADQIRLAEHADEPLADLARVGRLTGPEHAALRALVAAAPDLASRPQHGDFWYQNVLMIAGERWAIDFDTYGELRVPLYDDFSMVMTTLALRRGLPNELFDRLASPLPVAQACRALIAERAAAAAIDRRSLDALFVYYLAQTAYGLRARGNIGLRYSAPYLEAARQMARRLIGARAGVFSSRAEAA